MAAAVSVAHLGGAVNCIRTITSAAGVLSQLEEEDLQEQALLQLDATVDQFWSEIADQIHVIEALYENENFKERKRAALVLSKVYYHLEEYEESLNYALGAGDKFKLSERTEYVEKTVTKCIDKYIAIQCAADKKSETGYGEPSAPAQSGDIAMGGTNEDIDPRLLDIVERMFARCKKDEEWYHGLGIAIECKRLDKVQDFVLSSPYLFDMIDYCQRNLRNPAIGSRNFRMQLVKLLIDIYKKQGLNSTSSDNKSSKINFVTKLLQCYCFSDDVGSTKDLLLMLLEKKLEVSEANANLLLLYQLCFDIVDNENQQFCRDLVKQLRLAKESVVGKKPEPVPEGQEAPPVDAALPAYDAVKDEEFGLALSVLCGLKRLDLNLEFLFKTNRTDLLILDKAKKACDQKNSMLHTGHMFMHAFMQAGTSSDIYLRQNLDWMSRAVMWAKFSTTASLGVVHRGHIKESRNILSTYLPRDDGGQSGSFYSEGGALYAMGLIHGNHYDEGVETYLLEKLRGGQHSEILRHGACLGLGLSSMGTHNKEIVEEMKQALFTDNAITGEAAAYGIGLVMCGSASDAEVKVLLSYAQDTEHEKIIRGCAIALALIMFQREEGADALIEQLLLDKDPILRYGGCFTIAMAYCGTSSSSAIRKLLNLAVSDVADDVRRAAVISLGFVMCNTPTRVPEMVKLLATSYNPHVRYAAAMALGISGAGSASTEAEEILRPLLTDTTDFVRQGAYVALALNYMQSVSEKANKFRTDVTVCISNKHEDVITRFGALLAQGLIDAGGRNVCATFFAKSTGAVRQGAGVGFLLFTQMWYWFPLIHGLSLAFNPTAIIGLNKDLKMPKAFEFNSDVTGSKVKQATFQYPQAEETKKSEETVTTKAILSAGKKKGIARSTSSTDASKLVKVASTKKEDTKDGSGDALMASESREESEVKKDDKKDEELPSCMTLKNPARVVAAQEKFIKFNSTKNNRYQPLLNNARQTGFLLLTDATPGEPEELVEAAKDTEPSPPEAFEWTLEKDD